MTPSVLRASLRFISFSQRRAMNLDERIGENTEDRDGEKLVGRDVAVDLSHFRIESKRREAFQASLFREIKRNESARYATLDRNSNVETQFGVRPKERGTFERGIENRQETANRNAISTIAPSNSSKREKFSISEDFLHFTRTSNDIQGI